MNTHLKRLITLYKISVKPTINGFLFQRYYKSVETLPQQH